MNLIAELLDLHSTVMLHTLLKILRFAANASYFKNIISQTKAHHSDQKVFTIL